MIALACRTGIAPSVWAAEGERVIVTALEVLEAADRASGGERRVLAHG